MIYMLFPLGFLTASVLGMIAVTLLHIRWHKQKKELMQKHNQFVHVLENSKDFIYYFQVYPQKNTSILVPQRNFFGEGSIERAFKNPEVPFSDIHSDDYDILLKK